MKLSQAQFDLLENISFHEKGRPLRALHLNYAPMKRLIRKAAVEKTGLNRQGFTYWRITEAGRAALSDAKERKE